MVLLAEGDLLGERKDSRVLFRPLAAMLPFPTMLRDVSGKKKRRSVKQKPESIARNQKMLRQPRCCVIAPPSTGPRTDARFGLDMDSISGSL